MKVKRHIKKFFFESFRPRNGGDYAEVFTRGFKDREGANTVYPWLWLRVLCVLLITYTLYAVINAAMPGAGDREVFYFIGGAFLDIAFLVLLFELYPNRDLSLLTVLAVCVLGGVAADFISAFIYYFHGFEVLINGWKLAAIAGVGEEIAKGIPAFICVIALKKKDNPPAGFLIGAAVGTWFSITENASYIHGGTMEIMIMTATSRAFGCMFSHAVWTALITRAFCKYGFKSYKFYLTVILNMALHFCIDMPLEDYIWLLFTEAAACGICAFVWSAAVIYRDRRGIVPPAEIEDYPPDGKRRFAVTMSVFLVAMCASLLMFSMLYSNTYKVTKNFTVEEFKEFAHNGYVPDIDYGREYEEGQIDYYAEYEQGELKTAHQQVVEDDITYTYCYRAKTVCDENGNPVTTEVDGEEVTVKEMKLSSVYLSITVDGETHMYFPTAYVTGNSIIEYYPINPALSDGKLSFNGDGVTQTFVCDGWDLKTNISFFVCSAVALGWIITFAVMKKKNADA